MLLKSLQMRTVEQCCQHQGCNCRLHACTVMPQHTCCADGTGLRALAGRGCFAGAALPLDAACSACALGAEVAASAGSLIFKLGLLTGWLPGSLRNHACWRAVTPAGAGISEQLPVTMLFSQMQSPRLYLAAGSPGWAAAGPVAGLVLALG